MCKLGYYGIVDIKLELRMLSARPTKYHEDFLGANIVSVTMIYSASFV